MAQYYSPALCDTIADIAKLQEFKIKKEEESRAPRDRTAYPSPLPDAFFLMIIVQSDKFLDVEQASDIEHDSGSQMTDSRIQDKAVMKSVQGTENGSRQVTHLQDKKMPRRTDFQLSVTGELSYFTNIRWLPERDLPKLEDTVPKEMVLGAHEESDHNQPCTSITEPDTSAKPEQSTRNIAPPITRSGEQRGDRMATKEVGDEAGKSMTAVDNDGDDTDSSAGTIPVSFSLLLDFENQHTVKLGLVAERRWREENTICYADSTFYYYHGNIEKSDESIKVRMIEKIEDVSFLAQYGLDEQQMKHLERHIAIGCAEVQISGRGWSDLGAAYGLRTHLDDAAYRPEHLRIIKSIRERIEDNHITYLLIFRHDHWSVKYASDKFVKFRDNIKKDHHSPPNDRWGTYRYNEATIVPSEERPKYIHPAQITFQDGRDLLTTDFHAELFDLEYNTKSPHKVKALQTRLISIPGGTGTSLLALVDRRSAGLQLDNHIDKEAAADKRLISQLSMGDRMKVRIHALNPKDIGSKYWHGIVVEPPAIATSHDLAIDLTSYRDDRTNKHTVVDLAPVKNSIIQWSDMKDAATIKKIMNKVRPCFVDLDIQADEKNRQRLFQLAEAVREMFLTESKAQGDVQGMHETLLCGTRLDKLPRYDAYEGIPDDIIEKIKEEFKHRPDQLGVLNHMRSLPGGVALITGIAGCGKSFLLYRLVKVVWEAQHAKVPDVKLKLLAASFINDCTDNIARMCKTLGHGIKVLRMHATETEKSIAFKDLRGIKPAAIDKVRFDEYGEGIKDLFFARSLYRQVKQRNEVKIEGVHDERVIEEHYKDTASYKLLYAAGILDDSEPPTREEYIKFNTLFRAMEKELEAQQTWEEQLYKADLLDSGKLLTVSMEEFTRLTKDTAKAITSPVIESVAKRFEQQYAKCLPLIIQDQDVIVVSLALATEACLSDFNPNMLLIDEAGRAPSLYLEGCIATHCKARTVILTGDVLQCKTDSKAPASYNTFGSQLHLPLFHRLILTGLPHVDLYYSERLDGFQKKLISEMYCPLMTTSQNKKDSWQSDKDRMADRIAIIKTWTHRTPAYFNHIAMNIGKSTETVVGPSRSKRNVTSATAVWVVLEAIAKIDLKSFMPQHFLILSVYREQVRYHKLLQSTLADHVRQGKITFGRWTAEALEAVVITTVMKAQGAESRVTLFDVTSAGGAGQVKDPGSLLVSFSRAQDITLVLYDEQSLAAAGELNNKRSKLAEWAGLVKQWGLKVRLTMSEPLTEHPFYSMSYIAPDRPLRRFLRE